MPKLTRLVSTNEADHLQGVTWLLDMIASKFNKRHGDVVIAYHEDVSVYAVRQWLKRPIPKRHHETLARLSELPMAEIERIASKNFHSVAMRKSGGGRSGDD